MSGFSGNSMLRTSIGDDLRYHFYRGSWVTERAVVGKLPRKTLFIEQLGEQIQGSPCIRSIK